MSSVDQNHFALPSEGDKNIPNVLSMEFESSTDSSSSDFQNDKECTTRIISVTQIDPVSPSNNVWVPSSQSDNDSNGVSNKNTTTDKNQISTSGPISSTPKELRILPSQHDDKPYTLSTEPSTIRDNASTTASVAQENVSSAIEPIASCNKIETCSTVSNGILDSVADEESSDEEPFIARLLREAEELKQRAKLLARAVAFDEGESNDIGDQSVEAASQELGTFPSVTTLQNVDYFSSIEEAPAGYFISTEKPITKEMAREIFSRDIFPQVFSITPTPDDDVSTLWGGTHASRDFRTGLASIRDDEESGLPLSDNTPPGQLPEQLLQSRWKHPCRDRTRIEVFFGLLTLLLGSVGVVLIIVVFAI